LLQSGPIEGYDSLITGANSYEETAGSSVVMITSGVPRKPGMSRDDLVLTNARVIRSVTEQVARYSPECILVMMTNPLDAMCQVAMNVSGFPRERVVGQAGVLDSARFRAFIARELDVSVEDVTAFVLGGHGDTMVPLPRYSTVAGIPITELLPPDRLEAIVQRTRDGGAEIVGLLKTGSAFYAPSSAMMAMVDSIVLDKKRVLPCAAYLTGEYGIDGLFVGVPVKLGARGIEEIIQITLLPDEQAALQRSAQAVRDLINVINNAPAQ